MSVEYDLVVIGNSAEGILAAMKAVSLNARVALVEQPYCERQAKPVDYRASHWETIYSRTFARLTHLSEQIETASQIGVYQIPPNFNIELAGVKLWTDEVDAILSEQRSPAFLAALGIDYILGSGEFCRLPRQAFLVGERRLRSRSYLLATGWHYAAPVVEEIDRVGYLTPNDLQHDGKLVSLPENLAIVGESEIALQLAQFFSKTARNIVLISANKTFLPSHEPEIANLIQAQLEADGVTVLVDSPLTQVRTIDEKKWLQVGDKAIECDDFLWIGKQQPNIKGLNLEGVGVTVNELGIQINEDLKTTNPRIYAYHNLAGKVHHAVHEANIAIEKILFFSSSKNCDRIIPQVVYTKPSIASFGMKEVEARNNFGQDILVIKINFKALDCAQILGETSGFLKLIVRKNGKILGAHIIGDRAEEIMSAIAVSVRAKVSLKSLSKLSFPSLSFTEILQKAALEWQEWHLKNNPIQKFIQKFWKAFWNWRRKFI
jgi:pyruvate/2-oxoglutarate dehydrogenase complex dihydrolipoamide dehydrogenase (E3) component